MSATLHLARFGPADAARMVGRMARGRKRLRATPGLAVTHLFMLAELDPVMGGIPRPLRWGLLCGWDDPAARDAFYADGARRFTHGARERWAASLETVRVGRGTLHGWQPRTDGAERFAPGEPVLVMTHGRVHLRHVPVFTVHNQRIARSMAGHPAVRMKVGAADHPLTRATFSVWRDKGEVVRFAYGRDAVHAPVQRTALDVPWADDFFFARFRPLATAGSWLGRDPLD